MSSLRSTIRELLRLARRPRYRVVHRHHDQHGLFSTVSAIGALEKHDTRRRIGPDKAVAGTAAYGIRYRYLTLESSGSPSSSDLLDRLHEILRLAKDNVALLDEAQALIMAAISDPVTKVSLDEARIVVFDAWMGYFDQLTETNEGDKVSSATDLAEIRRVVDQAQVVLELLVPMLKHNRHGMSDFLFRNTSVADLELPSATPEIRQRFNIPLSHRCNLLIQAWGTLSRIGSDCRGQGNALRAVPQRAQYILEQMECTMAVQSQQQLETDQGVILRPSIESYNAVLKAWALSHEHMRGNMAEKIFQKIPRRNGDSYRLVIHAWCNSRERRAAFYATGHLMKMLRRLEQGEEDFEPSQREYHVILKAWETAEDRTSPSKAQSVLRLVEHAKSKEITTLQPDLSCYRSVLKTAAQRPSLPELGKMVDGLLTKMSENFIIPDADCYSAAIRTWRNCALHPDNFDYREAAVTRTLELLSDMNTAHSQSMGLSIKASTTNVNDALEALSVSNQENRFVQAGQLLDNLGNAADADSYRFAINVWGTSDGAERMSQAQAILCRLKERHGALLSRNKQQDLIEVFNAFVRICGSVHCRNDEEALSVFREALGTIEDMKALEGLRPNSSTYAALLESCKNLLPFGTQRYRVVQQVLQLCSDDGMVDEHVLRMLRLTTSTEQYAKLVVTRSEDVEGLKLVPELWTVNVLGGRVVTTDGRRTTPLTIDGQLAETFAMKEFQMRRMRDKRNRNLLQGGRLREKNARKQPET